MTNTTHTAPAFDWRNAAAGVIGGLVLLAAVWLWAVIP